ncbi:SlyX family protein [Marinobacterium arenosum]|uniref:SlyX family protein n=1 Tax=Marinobacterium arenosum TaxID=2862496 RepID=UPI001C967C5B|nr:SlyX family protein [Marinobacterium arenosum]MBY4679004.1 SlyX family protein [Marinobacterium arenosum]
MSDMDRMAEMETRIAFQEDAIDKLSDIVARQERELAQLTEMVKLLNRQLKQLDLSHQRQPSDEPPPPHY